LTTASTQAIAANQRCSSAARGGKTDRETVERLPPPPSPLSSIPVSSAGRQACLGPAHVSRRCTPAWAPLACGRARDGGPQRARCWRRGAQDCGREPGAPGGEKPGPMRFKSTATDYTVVEPRERRRIPLWSWRSPSGSGWHGSASRGVASPARSVLENPWRTLLTGADAKPFLA